MKIKYEQIQAAVQLLRNKASLGDNPKHEIEFTLREEDPGAGKLGECMIISAIVTKKPNQYDDFKSDITTEYTLEVFAAHENRPIRWTAVETRDLI